MGIDALRENGISKKLLYFFRDKTLTPAGEPLRKVRKSRILLFVGVQLVGFGATFAITQSIGLSVTYASRHLRLIQIRNISLCRVSCAHHVIVATSHLCHTSIPVYSRRALYSRRTHRFPFCKDANFLTILVCTH